MGKFPGKTLVESAFAIFDTLRRGAPNVFPGLSPIPALTKKLWVKFSADDGKAAKRSLVFSFRGMGSAFGLKNLNIPIKIIIYFKKTAARPKNPAVFIDFFLRHHKAYVKSLL
jgi:hypothetical protein